MALISSAIAAISTFIGGLTWAAVGTFALKAVASMGLSLLAQKLSGKKGPQKQPFGVKGQLERGADVPQAVILGRYATAGSLTYANTSSVAGSPNGYMTWAITLSDLPVAGLAGIWVNGTKRDIMPAGPDGWQGVDGFQHTDVLQQATDDYRLTLRFYDGSQAVADAWLTSISTEERPWDQSAVGLGKSYVVMRARADSDLFPNGFPNFLFEVDGIPMYNPAEDSAAGGVGPMRPDAPEAWEVTENPAVQLFNVLRGIRYHGGGVSGGDILGVVDLTGKKSVSFRAVGGGGGAAQEAYGGEDNSKNPGADGQAGADLVVTLKDGASVVQTWTARGGAGGLEEVDQADGPDRFSRLSPRGDGGAPNDFMAFLRPPVSAGWPGQFVEVKDFDISALSSPSISVSGGAGGAGGQSSGGRSASNGGAGGASYSAMASSALAPSPEWFYGLQDVSLAQLPLSHWIAQINKCGAQVEGADGPEPRFRSSAEIPVDAEIHTVIESLLDACNGRLSDAGGVYKLFAGDPGAPVMSFTDDDIISTHEQTFTPFLGLSDTVNGVVAKYPSPDAGWQVETAPPLYRPDYEAEDGGRRLLVDVSLDFVPYAEQAQRLMKAALNEARRARRHTLTLPPKYWPLEPGDVIEWASVRNGYAGKHFRVDGVVDMPDADVMVDLTEVDPADYDWDSATDFVPPVLPSTLPVVIPAQVLPGFDVRAASIVDESGDGRRPAIEAAWSPDLDDVRAVKIECRVKNTGALIDPALSNTPQDGGIVISAGVLPATEYEVRAQVIPDSPRPAEWTAWRSVTTYDIRIAPGEISDAIWDAIRDDATSITDGLLNDFATGTFAPAIAGIDDTINDLDADIIRIDAELLQTNSDVDQWQIDQIGITSALATANDRIIWATTLASNTESLVRDAGVYVDPDDGVVKIAAVETQANRINDTEIRLDAAEGVIALKADQTVIDGHEIRLSQAEIDIDAVDGAILLKVDQTDFDAVETRIETAEIELSTIDGPAIRQTVSDTRILFDDLDLNAVNDLETLLNAYETREVLKRDLAYAQRDLRARVDDDRVAVAESLQDLGAAIDANVASIKTEQSVRASETGAIARDLTALDVRVEGAEGDITGQATAIGGLTTRVTDAEGVISSQAQDVTNLRTDLTTAEGDITGQATAIGGLTTRVTDAEGVISSQAQDVTNLRTTVGEHTSSINQTINSIDGISSEYTLRIDNNGVVSGMVLRSDLDDAGVPASQAGFIADKFAITGPAGEQRTAPFVVYTTPQVINGVTVQPGVYMRDATIRDASITNAKIAGEISSSNFETGASGWALNKNGDAEFNNLIARGSLVVGATTDFISDTVPGFIDIPTTSTLTEIAKIRLGPLAIDDQWSIHGFIFLDYTYGGADVQFRHKVKKGGVWGAASVINSNILNAPNFIQHRSISKLFGGVFEDVEFSIMAYQDGPNRFMDASITAEKRVR